MLWYILIKYIEKMWFFSFFRFLNFFVFLIFLLLCLFFFKYLFCLIPPPELTGIVGTSIIPTIGWWSDILFDVSTLTLDLHPWRFKMGQKIIKLQFFEF